MKPEEIDLTQVSASPAPISYTQVPGLHNLTRGGHTMVLTLDGTLRPCINLDNVASTRIALPVKRPPTASSLTSQSHAPIQYSATRNLRSVIEGVSDV